MDFLVNNRRREHGFSQAVSEKNVKKWFSFKFLFLDALILFLFSNFEL